MRKTKVAITGNVPRVCVGRIINDKLSKNEKRYYKILAWRRAI